VRFLPTEIPDVVLIEPDVHRDARGFFLESHHAPKYARGGIDAAFVQDNHSRSTRGTLRGLHAQLPPRAQGKLVRVSLGEVFDVAVDVRRGSPTFGKHVAQRLSAENFRQLWIPPGFVHGFLVTSEVAEFQYKCTDVYDPAAEIVVAWNDPALAIPWPVAEPILSARDAAAPTLAEIAERLPRFEARR
jgi:dTDP-4-dehydrorhamnose 3,5-epimerase